MRRTAVAAPLAALAAGILGFYMRQVELNTVIDKVSGLAVKNAPITLALIAVSIAAAVASLLFAAFVSKRYEAYAEYERAFAPHSVLYLVLHFFLAFMMIVADVMLYAELSSSGIVPLIELVFIIFSVLTAFSLIVLARGAYSGHSGNEMLLFSSIPPLFLCFWLILLYKKNAANPVLLAYSYQCLALAVSALGFYFSAGFAFKKPTVFRTTASLLFAVYLCTLVLADTIDLPIKILFLAFGLSQLINLSVFLINLHSREKSE